MSEETNEKMGENPEFLTLHNLEGKKIYLRKDFIISAMGHSNTRNYTTIKVDRIATVEYKVREQLDAIKGPFATVGGLKLNPDYVVSVTPNAGESAETYPYSINMRTSDGAGYVTVSSPDKIMRAIEKALKNGPF